MKTLIKTISLLLVINLLSACKTTMLEPQDGPPQRQIDISHIPDAKPQLTAKSRYGNPPSYEVLGKRYEVLKSSRGYHEKGIASWYGMKFNGKLTSSREVYDLYGMTAAHKTLPLPTYVKVTNLENGKHVILKVNDRGPFHENRVIDLSYAAAKKLDITRKGTGLVDVVAISPTDYHRHDIKAASVTHKPEIYLQVGAFSDKRNAERLAQKIHQLIDQPVSLKTNQSHQHAIFKVQIGPLVGVGITDKLQKQIQTAGIGDAVAVIE